LFPVANAQAAMNALRPARVFLWTFAVFGLGLLVAPVTPDVIFSTGAVICWLAVIAMSLVGAAVVAPNSMALRDGHFLVRQFPAKTLARRCIAIGTAGVMLSVVDRFFIRGAPLSFDILAAREVVTDAGSSVTGLLAAALSSFAPLGLVSSWLARAVGQPLRRWEEAMAGIALLVYLALSVALGSRSLMVVCVLLHVFAGVFFQLLRRGRVNWRVILTAVGILLVVVGASALLMLARLEQMGLSPIASIQVSAYAYTLKPSSGLLQALDGNEQLGGFGAALYSLVVYIYHGVYEFLLLFDSYRGEWLLGAENLWLPLKVISIFTGSQSQVDLESLPGFRTGVYTTMAGPMYLDFGWLAPLFACVLFMVLGYPFRRVMAGDLRWLPAALQVAVIIMLAPVVSLLDSSAGTFLLLAAIALPCLTLRLS
jgi:hypothetical protein